MTKLEVIKDLYQRIADHTKGECDGDNCGCNPPRSCCSPEYCEMTIEYAEERHGVRLERTAHERLPLMGPAGCTAEPYLRPACSLHACCINGIGFKMKGENPREWTERYFELREAIENEENT